MGQIIINQLIFLVLNEFIFIKIKKGVLKLNFEENCLWKISEQFKNFIMCVSGKSTSKIKL